MARNDRLTVRERIDFQREGAPGAGRSDVERVCEQLRERDVAAVAICLLHSYANDAHERRIAEAIARPAATCASTTRRRSTRSIASTNASRPRSSTRRSRQSSKATSNA